jgi:hypothetical protein
MIRAPALTAAGLVLAAYVIRRRYLTRPRIVRDGPVSSTTRRASVSSTTLDPRSPEDWASLRANAHALLHECIDRMESANEGRTWTPVPAAIKDSLHEPLPREGISREEQRARLAALLPYGVGNTHPRFFGWVHGSGCPGGVLPELVGAAMNANCGGREHAAIHVEKQVLEWARAMMGFPPESGALLVSGTSMATIVALKCARDWALGFESSRKGGIAQAQARVQGGGGGGGGRCGSCLCARTSRWISRRWARWSRKTAPRGASPSSWSAPRAPSTWAPSTTSTASRLSPRREMSSLCPDLARSPPPTLARAPLSRRRAASGSMSTAPSARPPC